jgi:thiol-disulfide isomerase/thioredoxin
MIKPDQGTEDREPGPIGRREFITGTLASLTAAIGGLAPILATANTPSPEFRNNVTQFRWFRPQTVPRQTPFLNANGDVLSLQNFRGKTLLVNFWATWCKPCLVEMPALDRLQKALSGDRFSVLAIAIDRGGLAVVEPFYRRMALNHLGIYLDPSQSTGYLDQANPNNGAFALYSLPISYLIDRHGWVLGYFPGSADWDKPKAVSFLQHFIAGPGR